MDLHNGGYFDLDKRLSLPNEPLVTAIGVDTTTKGAPLIHRYEIYWCARRARCCTGIENATERTAG